MMLLTVQSALEEGQVALWEKHPAHPGGEVFIADGGQHQAAATQQVLAAIARNVLVIVPDVEVPAIEPAVPAAVKTEARAGGSRTKKEAEG